MSTLTIALVNQTTSNDVYAYITGQALNNKNALFLLSADKHTPYYPSNPTSTGTHLTKDCAIALGAPGTSVNATIPQIAGGRIWFSIGAKLTFLVNPGPGLVEPSVTNPSDPNINTLWGFCEFTFNSSQLYANISYVDFVSLPIALTLSNTSGHVQRVSGMSTSGLDTVCSELQAQSASDGQGWKDLVIKRGGSNLRALSPNNGIQLNKNLFHGYWQPYVDQVWSQYARSRLNVNTQAQWGTIAGAVSNNHLTFGEAASFAQPSSADIFSNSSGPFAGGSAEKGAITARLCAAFNRSTLLTDADQPDNENPANYYKNPITNHYARIVHAANLDTRGYAFPYDDVAPSNGNDQSGFVNDGAPKVLTVAVGGGNASAAASHLHADSDSAQIPL